VRDLALAIFALLSLVLTVWRWSVALRFPLHRRTAAPTHLPGLTILKPVKGCGAETRRCLQSWFALRYPGSLQILFGVAEANDPACQVVRDLIGEFPGIDAQLVICNKDMGANGKVSNLRQLEPLIRHPLVMISDADVEVDVDFAAAITPLLANPDVGLVNCFYQMANPGTAAMRWEAVAVNADFWSQVLQARSLGPVRFALGAVMTLPASVLQRIGGFAPLADFLADDYQLGQFVTLAGCRIEFSTEVVHCREMKVNWTDAWKHQLRWARTIRICQPLPYLMSILGNATLWPLLWVAGTNDPLAPPFFAAALLFRILSAGHQQKRLTKSNSHWSYWWLPPVKDLLDFLIWAAAFWGNSVDWRGEHYRILSGGKLLKINRSPQPGQTTIA
jgi:ceramide glucosyltransferase